MKPDTMCTIKLKFLNINLTQGHSLLENLCHKKHDVPMLQMNTLMFINFLKDKFLKEKNPTILQLSCNMKIN